ncbi:formylglycine-generating enzyme family protein [Thalassoglobus sp.]|uniref:formylglycine-generating enzyme family protein n=1 Tax=Thalassoglobus sp. TaxID=2795869 RepID=UPI003AA7D7CF
MSHSPPPAVAPFDASEAKTHQNAWAEYLGLPVEKEVELPGAGKMVFMLIPPGEFMMGSTEEEQAKFLKESESLDNVTYHKRILAEDPQHFTRITQPFYLEHLSNWFAGSASWRTAFLLEKYVLHGHTVEQTALGKFEVTQIQWQSMMENNPAEHSKDETGPVDSVSWNDVQEFLTKMNTGVPNKTYQFVLPTEAQWELACRAGTTSYWHSGNREPELHDSGWSHVNSRGKTHPVGQLAANPFGLYDIHGNVFEWCSDWYVEETYSTSPVDDPTGPPNG